MQPEKSPIYQQKIDLHKYGKRDILMGMLDAYRATSYLCVFKSCVAYTIIWQCHKLLGP